MVQLCCAAGCQAELVIWTSPDEIRGGVLGIIGNKGATLEYSKKSAGGPIIASFRNEILRHTLAQPWTLRLMVLGYATLILPLSCLLLGMFSMVEEAVP